MEASTRDVMLSALREYFVLGVDASASRGADGSSGVDVLHGHIVKRPRQLVTVVVAC
jgi:hypothetical protein